ncbi:MAG: hypothetical protein JW969_14875 [Spirochaetales bacterium]|nr:hypothetical protein [Spirochaetales bacterium]
MNTEFIVYTNDKGEGKINFQEIYKILFEKSQFTAEQHTFSQSDTEDSISNYFNIYETIDMVLVTAGGSKIFFKETDTDTSKYAVYKNSKYLGTANDVFRITFVENGQELKLCRMKGKLYSFEYNEEFSNENYKEMTYEEMIERVRQKNLNKIFFFPVSSVEPAIIKGLKYEEKAGTIFVNKDGVEVIKSRLNKKYSRESILSYRYFIIMAEKEG